MLNFDACGSLRGQIEKRSKGVLGRSTYRERSKPAFVSAHARPIDCPQLLGTIRRW